MAWQLIYTSAPRLLEAGRSGFGTVARHRDIPPLVVAAVERISQFSRQQGLDPGRVIYAHRILSISGQRFHVLSCIRDAGADYTGRTNHLAHHLIAEPHEVASLGISSADVLMQMPWLTAWTEQPRWLEVQETIPLASFPSATGGDGARWGAVTGDPRHAQLLANGDASHGCYLVAPANTDLRPLLAESLNLARERRWQVAFTTSLQPSDEPTDFRWLGLEATSPLRAATETSGRIVLDLARPHTLPAPPAPTTPATPRIERASSPAQSSVVEPVPVRTASAPASTAPVFRDDRWARQKDQTTEAAPTRSTPRKSSKWLLVSGATAVLIIGVGLGGAVLYRRATLKTERANMVARLPDFARTGPKGESALDGILWSTHDKAKALATAADVVAGKLESGKLDDLDLQPLQLAANNAEAERMNVSAYRDVLNVASEVAARRDEAKKPKPLDAVLEPDNALLQKLTAALHERAAFKATRDELQHLWLVREADALYKALEANTDQKLSLQKFRGAIDELDKRNKPDSPVASLDKARAIVSDWKEVAANNRIPEKDSWPRWLREDARRSSTIADRPDTKPVKPSERPSTSVDKPKVSSYLAVGLENLRQLTIQELGTQVKFQLIESGQTSPSSLVVINQNVRRTVAAPTALFSIDAARQILTAEEGANTLQLPALLRVSSSDDNPKPLAEIQIVGGKMKEPIIPPRSAGLSREGETLRVDLSFVPRTANARWLLQLPDAPPDQFLTIEEGVVKLRDVLRVREEAVGDWQARLKLKQRTLAELTNPKDIEAKLTQQCSELDALFPDATKNDKGGDKKGKKDKGDATPPPPPPTSGDAISRLGGILRRVANNGGDIATGGQWESLFKCGVALENVGKDPMTPSQAVTKASSLIQGMFSFKNEDTRKQWTNKLEKLKAACATAAAFIAIGSEESKGEKTRLSNEIAQIEKQIAALKFDPWQNGGLPKGDYSCVVEVGGQRVTVTTFRIP